MDMRNLNIRVPGAVKEILHTLKANGYEAYIVGGCVRDAVLGVEPQDWDITTSALPLQVKSLFSNTVDTGIQHGTVMVIRKGCGYEVTTYRIDGEYKDGRHPEKVTFTRSLEEDLKRRDFTINAFAWDPETGIVDLFDGLSDLENRLIRCVGDPNERFEEDALRIMRAVRFSAQLSFRIEEETLKAIGNHVQNLKAVSMERIRVEFEKTLLSRNPEKVSLFAELKMVPYLIPDPQIARKCFDPALSGFYAKADGEEQRRKVLRLAVFFRNLSPEESHRALRLMKYDNKTISLVCGIIKNKDGKIPDDRIAVKRMLSETGEELFDLILAFRKIFADDETRNMLARAEETEKEILRKQEPFTVAALAVNGKDLMEAGIPQGKEIGEQLQDLLNRVIEDETINDRETLLRIVKENNKGA